MQNIINWSLWIRKNKFIIQSKKSATRYWLNLFKDSNEARYRFLIKKHEDVGTKPFINSKAFIECSNDMDNIYKNIEEYNPNKKCKIFVAFDDMVADMLNNKNLNPIVTELFIRGRKLNISLAFITQSYFVVSKDIILNSTHYFITKIPNKKEFQQIASNHSLDIDFQDFMNLYKECTAKPYSFLAIDSTLASDNFLRFRKILAEII